MIANLNGYQVYQQNKYSTASPHKLITMLYEGALKFGNQVVTYIEQGDIQGKARALKQFQDIIYELISCLNFKEGKKIADNLYSLYSYVLELSTRSNIQMRVEPMKEALKIISEIKETWEQIGKDVKVNG